MCLVLRARLVLGECQDPPLGAHHNVGAVGLQYLLLMPPKTRDVLILPKNFEGLDLDL